MTEFRAHVSAAPLKLSDRPTPTVGSSGIPRSRERGPIEAIIVAVAKGSSHSNSALT